MDFILGLSLIACGLGASIHDLQGKTSVYNNFPENGLSVEDVQFGYGYNTINLRPSLHKVVDIEKVVRSGIDFWDAPASGFIESHFKISLCQSREELFEQLEGGLSVPAASLGTAPEKTKDFLDHTDITILDSVLLATVEAITDTKSVFKAQFTAEALALSQDYPAFVQKYGTHYLRKIYIGGKMLLVMKFSSTTVAKKEALDKQLKSDVVGMFNDAMVFNTKLQKLEKGGSDVMEVSLYAQGTDTPPLHPSLKDGIRYAFEFSKDLLKYRLVRGLEYTAIWTVPDCPTGLRQYIIEKQIKTDRLVQVSADLLQLKLDIADIQQLKKGRNAFFSTLGWSQLGQTMVGIGRAMQTLREDFQSKEVSQFDEIITAGRRNYYAYKSNIEDIVAGEKKYGYLAPLTLRNEQKSLFVARASDGYPTLWSTDPVPLVLKETTGSRIIRFMIGYYFLKSSTNPNKYLCMGKTSKYVFWSKDQADNEMCQWRLIHATDTNKSFFEYGDSIKLYNRHWNNYIMGEDGSWIGAVKADHGDTWYVGKRLDIG